VNFNFLFSFAFNCILLLSWILDWRIEEILFQSQSWISLFIYCLIEFPFLLLTSSSILFAIYNFLAIVLVGSRKALRSRLGFLVSGS